MLKAFRTLRGFIEGDEPDEPTYFAHSATLRVFGVSLDFDRLTRELGVEPTETHRQGERRGPSSPPFKHDYWAYSPTVAEDRPLSDHIDALWHAIRHAEPFLLELKETYDVDVFLGYRSNVDHAGIEVPYTCLELFTRLQVPFGVSIIIT